MNTPWGEVTAVTHDDWGAQAVCASVDPEIVFLDKGGSPRPAKRVCARCPVAKECLRWALDTGQAHGVWGGLTTLQRNQIRRRPAPPPPRRERRTA